MDFQILMSNLTNPTLLFFVLGIVAAIVKSDLEIPEVGHIYRERSSEI